MRRGRRLIETAPPLAPLDRILMSRYRESMLEVYVAHQRFRKKWDDWQAGRRPASRKEWGAEPASVTAARDEFRARTNFLYQTKLDPLAARFRAAPRDAFDEALEVLTADVPAFGTGYAKEVFLQKLKAARLSPAEAERLRAAALAVCEAPTLRREFRRWCRLMIVFADAAFAARLGGLIRSENRYARIKARWMRSAILRQRTDLRGITTDRL